MGQRANEGKNEYLIWRTRVGTPAMIFAKISMAMTTLTVWVTSRKKVTAAVLADAVQHGTLEGYLWQEWRMFGVVRLPAW